MTNKISNQQDLNILEFTSIESNEKSAIKSCQDKFLKLFLKL